MKKALIALTLLASPAFAVETKTAINVAAVSNTSTVTASAVITDFTSVNAPVTTFRIVCTTDTYAELGVAKDATPTGYVTNTTFIPAYVPEYFEMLERRKASLRAVSSAGSCNISKMGKGI